MRSSGARQEIPSQVSRPLPITEVSATHLQEACHMNAYAMKQYQTVNVHAQVTEADPHRLIQMLLEGGLQRIAQAKGAMEYGNIALKGELIGKAMGIIGGLRDAVDTEKGGEIDRKSVV